jgi:hypothetical protein
MFMTTLKERVKRNVKKCYVFALFLQNFKSCVSTEIVMSKIKIAISQIKTSSQQHR